MVDKPERSFACLMSLEVTCATILELVALAVRPFFMKEIKLNDDYCKNLDNALTDFINDSLTIKKERGDSGTEYYWLYVNVKPTAGNIDYPHWDIGNAIAAVCKGFSMGTKTGKHSQEYIMTA